MTIIEANPNIVFIAFMKPFKCIRIIDDNMFFMIGNINNNNEPIIFEYFKVIEQHLFTSFLLKIREGVNLPYI